MPPSNSKRTPKKGANAPPQAFTDLMRKIPPNPITGKVEMMDAMRYLDQNPEQMSDLVGAVDKLKVSQPKADLKTYDYKSLATTIVHESFWVLQLEPMGYVDSQGREVDPRRAHSSSGVKPTFVFYCYDEKGSYRIMHECVGLPDSDTVLEVIQKAIASPEIPLTPCLPWFFLLSIKLASHSEALRPFLDSLPKPFHWRVETREEAQGVHDGVDELNKEGKTSAMSLAEKLKNEGNKAFTNKDRDSAIKSYTDALGYLLDALSQKPDEKEEKAAMKLRAICFANRAAAYLIPGTGSDPAKALKDGKDSEEADPSYSKSYIRQATAHQQLGNLDDAKDVIARALKKKDLENDVGLVDRFIELITDGKGFSEDETTFKNFILETTTNDSKTAERMRDLQGLYQRRVDAHLKKIQH